MLPMCTQATYRHGEGGHYVVMPPEQLLRSHIILQQRAASHDIIATRVRTASWRATVAVVSYTGCGVHKAIFHGSNPYLYDPCTTRAGCFWSPFHPCSARVRHRTFDVPAASPRLPGSRQHHTLAPVTVSPWHWGSP